MRKNQKKVATDPKYVSTSVALTKEDRLDLERLIEVKYGGSIGFTTALRVEAMASVRNQLREMGEEVAES